MNDWAEDNGYVGDGDYCCTPDSGGCCGPGSWCCNRAGKHEHDADEIKPPVSAWDLLGIAPNYTGKLSANDWVSAQRDGLVAEK